MENCNLEGGKKGKKEEKKGGKLEKSLFYFRRVSTSERISR